MSFVNLGKRYVGLTDDPAARRAAHGNPVDWRHRGPFEDERSAREWEKRMTSLPGFAGGDGGPGDGEGWHFGYVYTITMLTRERATPSEEPLLVDVERQSPNL